MNKPEEPNKIFQLGTYLIKGTLFLLTVFSILNFFDELFPAVINLTEILTILLKFVRVIRDVIFFPLDWAIFKIFKVEIYSWLKTYIFLGLLLWRSYNNAHLNVCGFSGLTGLINLLVPGNFTKTLILIIWHILSWPYNFIELTRHILKGGLKNKRNVLTFWSKTLIGIFLCVFIIALLNFCWISWKNQKTKIPVEDEETVTYDKQQPQNRDLTKLPYHRKLPILDSTLYVEHYYTELKLGGKNFNLIKYDAMTIEGNTIEMNEFKNFDYVAFPIFDNPFIELKYKEIYFELRINKQYGQFYYSLDTIISPKLNLY